MVPKVAISQVAVISDPENSIETVTKKEDSDGSDAEEQPKRLIVEEKKDFDIQNLISDTQVRAKKN